MRSKFLFFCLILISNLAFGQIPKNAISIEDEGFNNYFWNKKNIPVVKRKILNLTIEETKQIKIQCDIVTPFENLQKTKYCELNTDGTFEIKLDYAFPYQQIWLSVGDLFFTSLYADKGLYVELDAQLLKSQKGAICNAPGVKYLSKDGALNTYMNNHVLYKRERQIELYRAISELNAKAISESNQERDYLMYTKKYDSLFAILKKLDNEYIKQNPSDFSWLLINERQSKYYCDLCVYYWRKQMPTELFEKIKNHKAHLTSNDGMKFYNYFKLKVDDDMLTISAELKSEKRKWEWGRIYPERIQLQFFLA